MGKATINSHLGDGQYSITTVFDTAAAAVEKTRLEAILAGVQEKLDADPAPSGETLTVLETRKTALEKEIEKITEAAALSRTQSAWCGDLTEDLSGTVATIEIGADPDLGLMVHPGYAGAAAYDEVRDGIETPFRTMNVADAALNLALLPAIQKWKPTFRYGTVSNVNQETDVCDLTLADAISWAQGININESTYFSSVPIVYMSCNGAAFEDDDEVLVSYSPYDVEGTIKVIGFKENPKPCESRHILVEVSGGWLLWDIVGKRAAYNLGEGAPTFPCEKNSANDNWVAAHVTDDADDTLYAYIGDTLNTNYVDPNRDFGPITEYWFNHLAPNSLIEEYFLGGSGCNAPGWGSSEDSAVCWGFTDTAERNNAYLPAFVSHTGDDPETTYGKNWGLWTPECCKYDMGPNYIPRYFTYRNSYREWWIYAPLVTGGFTKIIYSDGSEGNRAFVLCTDGYGETFKNYQFPYYVTTEHLYYFTLHFFSPFEADELSTTIDLWDLPASATTGLEVYSFSVSVQTKHNKSDMIGCCAYAFTLRDLSGGSPYDGDGSPHVDFYYRLDFNPEAEEDPTIPNPWDNLSRSNSLSEAVKDLILNYNDNSMNGFNYRFVDVT